MEAIRDFEDILSVLEKHKVRYLIVGGFAFIFHAKPRFTKDIDIWVDSSIENVESVNKALSEFGSPYLISVPVDTKEILQLGIAPNRIDILLHIQGLSFNTVWEKRIRSTYGEAMTNWIDIDSLILAKQAIDNPRHKEDVRVLLKAKELKAK